MKQIFKIIFFILSFLSLYAKEYYLYEIKNISFKGNTAFVDKELKNVITSKETPIWFLQTINKISNYGSPPSYLDTNKVSLDIKSLKNFYKDNGYFDATVKKEIIYDDDNYKAEIIYIINEGKPYYIKSYKIDGIQSVNQKVQDEINFYIKDTNKIFNRDDVLSKKSGILNVLLNNGYMQANIGQLKALIDTSKKSVEITFDVNLDKIYYISKIDIQKTGVGKDYVEDDLIEYVLNYKPGEIYNSDKIQRSQIRLVKTNIFSSVLVTSVIGEIKDNTVPLRATVDIGEMNEIIPDFFINDEDNRLNIGFGNTYNRKNFLGGARRLSVQNVIKFQDIYRISGTRFSNSFIDKDTSLYATYQAVISLNQPYFLGLPINNKIDFSLSLKKDKTFNNLILSSKLYFNFDLPEKVFLTGFNAYFSYEYVKSIYRQYYLIQTYKTYYNDTNSANISKLDKLFSDDKNRTKINLSEILGFELSSYKTDNLFFPRKGYNLGLLFEEVNSLPYLYQKIIKSTMSNPAFFKILLNGSYYTKILHSEENILATKIKLGKIFTYFGKTADLPNNRTFFIGGSNSIRGWLVRELYTKQIVTDNTLNPADFDNPSMAKTILNKLLERNLTKTGSIIIESSVEVRNILVGELGYTFFVDAGNIWNYYKKISLNDFGVASGFGFRYYSSFAPIRLDFAFKIWDPILNESIYRKKLLDKFTFQFGIGEAF
jgi:outer membrane protein insertion porin family